MPIIDLSIVTINYNNRDGLFRTCASLRALKQFEWVEHIIVDGGSSDGSVDELPNFDQFHTTIISEPDRGIYDAMNKGIRRSRGNFVWMLNSGDEFSGACEKLKTYIKVISAQKLDVALFASWLRDPGELGGDIIHCPTIRKMSFMMSVIHQSVLVKKEAHRKMGLYSLKYRLASDYDLVSRFSKTRKLKVSLSNFPISIFCMGGLTDKNYIQSRRESAHSSFRRFAFAGIWSLFIYTCVYIKRVTAVHG